MSSLVRVSSLASYYLLHKTNMFSIKLHFYYFCKSFFNFLQLIILLSFRKPLNSMYLITCDTNGTYNSVILKHIIKQ